MNSVRDVKIKKNLQRVTPIHDEAIEFKFREAKKHTSSDNSKPKRFLFDTMSLDNLVNFSSKNKQSTDNLAKITPLNRYEEILYS